MIATRPAKSTLCTTVPYLPIIDRRIGNDIPPPCLLTPQRGGTAQRGSQGRLLRDERRLEAFD